MTAPIILLNGASSAGKTTLAKAIQRSAARTYLHVALDEFIATLPDGTEYEEEWFPVRSVAIAGRELPTIETGPSGAKLLAGMRQFAAHLSTCGLACVVDDVRDAQAFEDYRARITSGWLIPVKVFAPLEEMERREYLRTDRLVGTAREQASRIHESIEYELEVDTAHRSADEAAREILSVVQRITG